MDAAFGSEGIPTRGDTCWSFDTLKVLLKVLKGSTLSACFEKGMSHVLGCTLEGRGIDGTLGEESKSPGMSQVKAKSLQILIRKLMWSVRRMFILMFSLVVVPHLLRLLDQTGGFLALAVFR